MSTGVAGQQRPASEPDAGEHWMFLDGEFVREAAAPLSHRAHALHNGTGVIEGIRAFWNADHGQLYLLEGPAHYQRLHRSARIIRLSVPVPADRLVEVTAELLRRNGCREDTYIRPILFKQDPLMTTNLLGGRDSLAVLTYPLGPFHDGGRGIRCMVSGWRRIPDSVIPARAKTTASYLNSALAKTEAVTAGYDEAIMLTHDGHVCESSTCNLFLLRDGQFLTPCVTDDILEGITRREVIGMLRDLGGPPPVERTVHRTELYLADELFICGTGYGIVPVVSVDGMAVGDGLVGPHTRRLMDLYGRAVRGGEDRYRHWLLPVHP
jgi:branched-chain amino acid aminotransferase